MFHAPSSPNFLDPVLVDKVGHLCQLFFFNFSIFA